MPECRACGPQRRQDARGRYDLGAGLAPADAAPGFAAGGLVAGAFTGLSAGLMLLWALFDEEKFLKDMDYPFHGERQ